MRIGKGVSIATGGRGDLYGATVDQFLVCRTQMPTATFRKTCEKQKGRKLYSSRWIAIVRFRAIPITETDPIMSGPWVISVLEDPTADKTMDSSSWDRGTVRSCPGTPHAKWRGRDCHDNATVSRISNSLITRATINSSRGEALTSRLSLTYSSTLPFFFCQIVFHSLNSCFTRFEFFRHQNFVNCGIESSWSDGRSYTKND